MPCSRLTVIAYCLIISRILYALAVREGFLSSELVAKIDAFLKRLKRFGYMTQIITTAELMNDAARVLFKQVCLTNHFLHYLLPPIRPRVNQQHRGHIYQLPTYCSLCYICTS